MNPQAVLQERYPTADFSVYFRFLEACRGRQRECGRTHEHHICPKKQFPEYTEGYPENLITLHVDDHAFAHKLLGAAVPELSNVAAWIAARHNYRHTEETRRRISEGAKAGLTGRSTSAAKKKAAKENARFGGLIAAQIHKKNGTGFYGLTLEQRRAIVANPSEDTRRKMSEAHRGKMHSEETRRKMSEAQQGRIVSDETRRKLSEANRGKKHSKETLRKLSDAARAQAQRVRESLSLVPNLSFSAERSALQSLPRKISVEEVN